MRSSAMQVVSPMLHLSIVPGQHAFEVSAIVLASRKWLSRRFARVICDECVRRHSKLDEVCHLLEDEEGGAENKYPRYHGHAHDQRPLGEGQRVQRYIPHLGARAHHEKHRLPVIETQERALDVFVGTEPTEQARIHVVPASTGAQGLEALVVGHERALG
jgi:hypothetical protein